MKKTSLLCLLLAVMMMLSGCTTSALPVTGTEPDATIPPARSNAIAPIGDSGLTRFGNMTLYLPCHDGINIAAAEAAVSLSCARPDAESVMRSLLSFRGSGTLSPLGGEVRLSLYGSSPVEVSNGTATVNLGASALQLSREQYYIVCQCIANTLTRLPEIDSVNVLVADKAIGLDIGNTQPMGTLTGTSATEIAALYEQTLSRREESSTRPFSCNVTLYFPLKGLEAVVSEVHTVTFSDRDFGSMVISILKAMENGPSGNVDSPVLPLLSDFLNTSPELVSSETAGGQIIRLDFAHNYEDMLETYGLTISESLASLCCTLCTFFPNVSGISVLVNGSPVSALPVSIDEIPEDQPELRDDFSDFLYDYATLYFAGQDGMPAKVLRPVPYSQVSAPRSLLYQLSLGPQSSDDRTDVLPVLKGRIQDSAVLGTSYSGNLFLVNFAPSIEGLITGCETEAESRLLAYCMTNTLCSASGARAAAVFVGGRQLEEPVCGISWLGDFFPWMP